MSLELVLFVVALGLALALFTVRQGVNKAPLERRRYAVLIGVALLFGLAVGRALHLAFADEGTPWQTWSLGPLAALALLELGPSVLAAVRLGLKTFAKVLARRFGGGR